MGKKIIKSICIIGGIIVSIIFASKRYIKIVDEKDMKIKKFKNYYNLANKWLIINNQGRNIAEYFDKNGWHNIAIYGIGELGNRLYEELLESNVKIHYAIDKEASNRYSNIKVLTMDDDLEPVDVIIVTPIFDYDAICVLLEKKTDIRIISLEDVIYNFI